MNKRIRQEIAQEAAKIIANSGHEDYLLAKKKAASQLGINDKSILPSNTEIETALIEYQSLFQRDQTDNLNKMRNTALEAMQFFETFQPVLVGSVVSGTANQYSEIVLHVFEDAPELIGLYLENKKLPATICERRLQFQKNKPVYFTAFKFLAGEFEIVTIVLPFQFKKNPPLDPINGKAMQRMKMKQLQKLLDGTTEHSPSQT